MFYSTAPDNVFIKLTNLKRQNVMLKYLEDINQLVIKSTAEEIMKYAPIE